MKSMRLAQRLLWRAPAGARNTRATGGIMLRLVAGAILVVVAVVVTTAIVVLPSACVAGAEPNARWRSMPPEHEPADTDAPGEDRDSHRGVGSELAPGDHVGCVLRRPALEQRPFQIDMAASEQVLQLVTD